MSAGTRRGASSPLRALGIVFLLAAIPSVGALLAAPERAPATLSGPEVDIGVLAIERAGAGVGLTLRIENTGAFEVTVLDCRALDGAGEAHPLDGAWTLAPGEVAQALVALVLQPDASIVEVACSAGY